MTDRIKSPSGRDGAQMRIRIPQALRELVRESAASELRHMNTQIVALIERGLKAKGPQRLQSLGTTAQSLSPQRTQI